MSRFFDVPPTHLISPTPAGITQLDYVHVNTWTSTNYLQVPGYFYANDRLEELTFEELRQQSGEKSGGGFLPAVKQIANVAALPGIVKV